MLRFSQYFYFIKMCKSLKIFKTDRFLDFYEINFERDRGDTETMLQQAISAGQSL